MRLHFKNIIWISLLISLLSACGFQLRGQYKFDFSSIDVSGMSNSELSRTMALQLKTHDLEVNPPQGSPFKINLISEKRDRSIVTFSATGRALEMRLTDKVTYSVTDKNADYVIATSELTQRRDLTYSDDQVLGKETEENMLFREMQEDISRQILGRLSSLSVQKK
jgi:LPS-assembly lipoprotein